MNANFQRRFCLGSFTSKQQQHSVMREVKQYSPVCSIHFLYNIFLLLHFFSPYVARLTSIYKSSFHSFRAALYYYCYYKGIAHSSLSLVWQVLTKTFLLLWYSYLTGGKKRKMERTFLFPLLFLSFSLFPHCSLLWFNKHARNEIKCNIM